MIVEVPQLPKYEARCDTVGCTASGREALNSEAARIFAMHDGWQFDGDKCICHRCAVLKAAAPPSDQQSGESA